METLLKDLRFGIRGLVESPGFTAIAVITLALGFGANCAIFSVVNAMLIRTLPFRDPDRSVWVWEVQPQLKQVPASYPELVDWRNMDQVFEQMSAGHGADFNPTGTGDPEHLPGFRHQVSGVRPKVRRFFGGCQVSGCGILVIFGNLIPKSEARGQKSENQNRLLGIFLTPDTRQKTGGPSAWHLTPLCMRRKL